MSSRFYRTLLRAATKIDNNHPILKTALSGHPTRIYSYQLKKNMEISKRIYSFANYISNHYGEYILPIYAPYKLANIIKQFARFHVDENIVFDQKFHDNLLHDLQQLELVGKQMKEHTLQSMPKPSYPNNSNSKNELQYIDMKVIGDETWSNSVFLQHPLTTKTSKEIGCEEPMVLLGLNIDRDYYNDVVSYDSLILNQPSSCILFAIVDYSNKKQQFIINTVDGEQTCPEVFLNNTVYYGGDTSDVMTVITTNAYCEGTALMNGKLFLNPNLKNAAKLIELGYAEPEDFKFFYGKVSWNHALYQNICDRNLFGSFTINHPKFSRIPKWLLYYWYKNENLWQNALKNCGTNWKPWISLNHMMNNSYEMKEITDRKTHSIEQQIEESNKL